MAATTVTLLFTDLVDSTALLQRVRAGNSRSPLPVDSAHDRRPKRAPRGPTVGGRQAADAGQDQPAVEREYLASEHGRETQPAAPRSLMETSDGRRGLRASVIIPSTAQP
jgi:hypothetical protein